jgi:hypothetical protein
MNMDESLSSRDLSSGQACQEGTGMTFPTPGEMNMDKSLSSCDHGPGQACQEGTGMSFPTPGEKVSQIDLLFQYFHFDFI